ncbi:MAG: hypothetical protein LBT05_10105 [Planctomycetaceae bacterium]|jgi:hypothetical protein|nr:hypothetical protein [Planctomycetaceae bacterium]
MSETIQQLVSALNHNADLLERRLEEGIYLHHQREPSETWAITHSLGSLRPLIETYDVAGRRIGHSVNRETQTFDFAEIAFAIPIAGTAILRF